MLRISDVALRANVWYTVFKEISLHQLQGVDIMILPDKWGQGALFASSDYIGQSPRFASRLCGDRFAFAFDTQAKCTLSVHCDECTLISFDAVMTDYIKARLQINDESFTVTAIFASPNTVLISSDYAIEVKAEFEQSTSAKKAKKCTVYSWENEEYALASKKENGRITYAFCYGKGADAIAIAALEMPFEAADAQRLSFYESLPEFKIPNEQIEKLYYRCASVLFACSRPGEGLIKSDYIAPAQGSMNGAYSFWSAICTLGMRHLAPDLAKSTLEAILGAQSGDGMIPSHVSATAKSCDINPPVLAWCMWELYQINKDADMLNRAYAPLKKYIHYIMERRDINKNHLFEWQTDELPELFGKESTMDNSPRFDDGIILDSIDLTSFVANEARYMSLIAEAIDKHGEALYWDVVFERIKNAVNELLFDEDDKIYYDRAVVSNMLKKVKSSASFLPLFAGVCENRNAMALLKFLNTPERFNRKFGVPSLSADEEEYSHNFWRGPVHIHHSYLIAKGLEKYEMHDKANELKAKSLDAVLKEYENCAVVYEYYCPDGDMAAASLPKKDFAASTFMLAQNHVNARDFAPTAAIIVDMLLTKSKKSPSK